MLDHIFAWLERLPLSGVIAHGDWLFPAIESVHVLALTIVFGSIAMVDLRLINVSFKTRTVSELLEEMIPWTWSAFVVAAITGSLMFISAATRYYGLWPFKLKMVLLACAGLNMLIFNFIVSRDVGKWGQQRLTPVSARISGGASLLLWTSIIVCGRWIGFL